MLLRGNDGTVSMHSGLVHQPSTLTIAANGSTAVWANIASGSSSTTYYASEID